MTIVNTTTKYAQATSAPTSSTTISVTSSGVLSGDVMLAMVTTVYQNASELTMTPPTGFNLLTTAYVADTTRQVWLYYHTAGNSEPTNYTWTLSGLRVGSLTQSTVDLSSFSGVDPSSPIEVINNLTDSPDSPNHQYYDAHISGQGLSLTNNWKAIPTSDMPVRFYVAGGAQSRLDIYYQNDLSSHYQKHTGVTGTAMFWDRNFTAYPSGTYTETLQQGVSAPWMGIFLALRAFVVTPPNTPPPPTPPPPPPPPPPTTPPPVVVPPPVGGPVTPAIDYNFVAGLNVTAVVDSDRYSSLTLSWQNVVNNYQGVAIQRSSAGAPTSVTEGTQVFLVTGLTQPTQFTDILLTSGQFYYYSLFGYDGTKWVWLDEAEGLVPQNYSFGDNFMDWTPGVYKNAEREVAGQADSSSSQLQAFYDIIGFIGDYTRTYVETLNNSYDIKKVSSKLLPALADEFGVTYERQAGAAANRSVVANAVDIWQNKGNVIALEEYLSNITGYGIQVIPSRNLLLDPNDSRPYQYPTGTMPSSYRWHFSATSSGIPAPGFTNDPVNWFPGPTNSWGPLTSSGVQDKTKFNLISYVHSAGATEVFQYGGFTTRAVASTDQVQTAALVKTNCVVLPTTTDIYCLSLRVITAPVGFTTTPHVQWYDVNGVYISTTTGATQSNGTLLWATFFPPSNAVYANPGFIFTGATGGTVNFGEFGFERNGLPGNYFYTTNNTTAVGAPFLPGQVAIIVNPSRANLIPSPDFGKTLGTLGYGWVKQANLPVSCVLSNSTDTYLETSNTALLTFGVNAGTTTFNTAGPPDGVEGPAELEKWIRVQRFQNYTWSVYVKPSALITYVEMSILWFKGPSSGDTTGGSGVTRFSSLTTGAWNRIFITAQAPAGAVYARAQMTISISGSSTLAVNAPLFEAASDVNDYFSSTSGAFAGSTTDLIGMPLHVSPWTYPTTRDIQPSGYYRNHDTFLPNYSAGTMGRIATVLDDTFAQGKNILLPAGASYFVIEGLNPEVYGHMQTRNNTWVYDSRHSWSQGLGECWDTEDIWTYPWHDLITRVSATYTWADELKLSWDDTPL